MFDPTTAALHLGITPELLFGYVRNAPKRDERRKLPYVNTAVASGFARSLKVFGVLAVVSATRHAALLARWAPNFREREFAPARETVLWSGKLGRLAFGQMPVDVALAMAQCMGIADANRADAASQGVRTHLSSMAADLEGVGLAWARPFGWIRVWAIRDGDVSCPTSPSYARPPSVDSLGDRGRRSLASCRSIPRLDDCREATHPRGRPNAPVLPRTDRPPTIPARGEEG